MAPPERSKGHGCSAKQKQKLRLENSYCLSELRDVAKNMLVNGVKWHFELFRVQRRVNHSADPLKAYSCGGKAAEASVVTEARYRGGAD